MYRQTMKKNGTQCFQCCNFQSTSLHISYEIKTISCSSCFSPQQNHCTWSWPPPSWRPLQSSPEIHSPGHHRSRSAHFPCWPCRGHINGLHLMICGAALRPPPPMHNSFFCKMSPASLFLDCVLCNAPEICQMEKLRLARCKAVTG